ncbi:hypothetical protein [Paenibacillus nuruki]|nr:hypothetical protein [Paenibacillus nuruki]
MEVPHASYLEICGTFLWGGFMEFGILLICIALLNCITIYFLKNTDNTDHIRDAVVYTVCILLIAIGLMTGIWTFYLGSFLYLGQSAKSNNMLKVIILFSGFPISYFMNNSFYAALGISLIFCYSMTRLSESFIELIYFDPKPTTELKKEDTPVINDPSDKELA